MGVLHLVAAAECGSHASVFEVIRQDYLVLSRCYPPTESSSLPHQVHGPINRDPEGNVLKSRSKSEVRHVAKIASEGFLGDDEKFSGYEYKVG